MSAWYVNKLKGEGMNSKKLSKVIGILLVTLSGQGFSLAMSLAPVPTPNEDYRYACEVTYIIDSVANDCRIEFKSTTGIDSSTQKATSETVKTVSWKDLNWTRVVTPAGTPGRSVRDIAGCVINEKIFGDNTFFSFRLPLASYKKPPVSSSDFVAEIYIRLSDPNRLVPVTPNSAETYESFSETFARTEFESRAIFGAGLGIDMNPQGSMRWMGVDCRRVQ